MKKTVVITGCGGRLGQQFISCYQNTYNIYGISTKDKRNNLQYNHIEKGLTVYNEIIDSIPDIDCWINNAYSYNMIDPKNYDHGFLQEIQIGLVVPYESSCYLYKTWQNKNNWSANKSILNISSIAGINFYDISQTTYGACKSGMNRMTIDLAKSFAGKIRVNAICPNSFPYYVTYETLLSSMQNFIEGKETAVLHILDKDSSHKIHG